MSRININSENMLKFFDNAISSIKSGMGNKLYDLASAMEILAVANDDPIFYNFPYLFGSLGHSVSRYKEMMMVPVLPPEVKSRLTKIQKVSEDQITKELNNLKVEVVKDPIGLAEIMESIGKLYKTMSNLDEEYRATVPKNFVPDDGGE